jgi:hypothetical protein
MFSVLPDAPAESEKPFLKNRLKLFSRDPVEHPHHILQKPVVAG